MGISLGGGTGRWWECCVSEVAFGGLEKVRAGRQSLQSVGSLKDRRRARFCGSGESVYMWNQETSGDAQDREKWLQEAEGRRVTQVGAGH